MIKSSFILYYYYMDRTEKLLSIIDRLLKIVEYEQCMEALEPIQEVEDDDEEWEEVTETVKDNSPKTLKEENEHLNNLVDMICEVFGFDKYDIGN